MNPITGTVEDGRIVLDGRVDWPNGTRVEILPRPEREEKFGLEESEWRDGPEALADWEAWLKAFEPLDLTAEEEAENVRFRLRMKDFNIEAVRRQMEEGIE